MYEFLYFCYTEKSEKFDQITKGLKYLFLSNFQLMPYSANVWLWTPTCQKVVVSPTSEWQTGMGRGTRRGLP